MKYLIILSFAVVTFSVLTPRAHALFGHVSAEHDRRQDAEQRIVQEQQRVVQEQQNNGQLSHKNEQLHTVISILSAGTVTALIIGAAIGSKTRKGAQ